MAQIDELKAALGGQSTAMKDYLTKAADKLNAVAEKAEGEFKDAVMGAHADVVAAKDHLEAYVNTANVAADAQPARGALRAPAADVLPGGEPVALSGVPVTPPAAPATGMGPAVPHVDIGQMNHATGESYDAPVVADPQAQPVIDPPAPTKNGDPVVEDDTTVPGNQKPVAPLENEHH